MAYLLDLIGNDGKGRDLGNTHVCIKQDGIYIGKTSTEFGLLCRLRRMIDTVIDLESNSFVNLVQYLHIISILHVIPRKILNNHK